MFKLRDIEDAGHPPHVKRPSTISFMVKQFFNGP